MKKVIFTVIILGTLSMFSCKKIYHCSCTYNNAVVYNQEIGSQYQNDAQNKCNAYDTTIIGEAWNCTIY